MPVQEREQLPVKIEFPCPYPIKVMGFAVENFQATVLEVIHRHARPVPAHRVSERTSAQGTYLAVTVVIEATGEEQLAAIFRELMDQASVKMVL
jgi:putative lipoic acid-binding regulatory protein